VAAPGLGLPAAALTSRPQSALAAAVPALLPGAPAAASAVQSIVGSLAQTQSALSAVPEPGGDNAARALDALFESAGRKEIRPAGAFGTSDTAGAARKSDAAADVSAAGAQSRAAALSRADAQPVEPAAAALPLPALSAVEEKGLADFVETAKSLFFKAGRAAIRAVLPEGIPSDEDMYKDMDLSPVGYAQRLSAVVALFQKAGANPAEIVLQDVGRGQKNVYVIKPGRTDRVIVVGSHHDMANIGRGTIDNWTGSTMAINLYQAMRDLDTEATYVFASFAREEDGLIGSAKYLKSLTQEQKSKIEAMVNLDTLAVDGTFSWKNNSSRTLLDLIKKVAAKEKLDLAEINLWGGDADSTSFRQLGILAMTIFGASPEVVFDIVHSERDTMAAFSMPHYRNAYMLALALLKTLNLGPVSAKTASAV
jgi:hypothetical protein